MTAGRPTWTEVLDAMERRLEKVQRIAAGEPDVYLDHFALPDGLGPLPAVLARRAEALLEATTLAEKRMEREMAAVADRLKITAGATRPTALVGADERPAPRYFDRSV